MKAGIRAAEPSDLAQLTDIYNHYVAHSHCTFDDTPLTLDQRRSWLEAHSGTGPHRLLVAEEQRQLVGYATSSRFRPKPGYDTSVEVSVYVRHDAQGKGFGGLLYTALFDLLAGQDLHRAYAGVALPNDVSIALHRRFDFREIGVYREVGRKFGRYWDVLWLEKDLS